MSPIDQSDIPKIVNNMKAQVSSGHDEISTKLMKTSIQDVLLPLTHIINQSLSTGTFPNQLRTAKVLPIYKSGEKSNINNYRPISLLPSFSTIYEKIMFNKVVQFMECNNSFYKHQYGFRANHSTIHPIIHWGNTNIHIIIKD